MIQADVYMMHGIPCEYRLQRISDGLFFGGEQEGTPVFCKDWNHVPYFGSALTETNEHRDEASVAFQWNWNINECEWTMDGLRQEDFRVHIVLGDSGN